MASTINADNGVSSGSAGLKSSADSSGILQLQSSGTTMHTIDSTGSYGQLKIGTVVASTSGTSIEFLNIPSWAKRYTLVLNGVSSSGTTDWLVQLGSGTYSTSGYSSTGSGHINSTAPTLVSSSSGFVIYNNLASDVRSGAMTIIAVNNNSYISTHTFGTTTARVATWWGAGGSGTLSGAVDRIKIFTSNLTDTFDLGSINLLYEG